MRFNKIQTGIGRPTFGRVAVRLAVVCLIVAAGLASSLALGERGPAAPSAATTFQQYARVKTWYSPASASNNAWVHFKTVDPDGHTMMEVLGSEIINLKYETDYINQTPKRRNLVDRLRGMMQDAGWTELGVDGDWYEYVFGR